MGWFWGKANPDSTNTDPLRDLDPSLRDFLSKEAPAKYDPAPAPPPPLPPIKEEPKPLSEPETPKAPSESLYPDGRYAHLWKTYRPLIVIENENKTDQQKLSDVYQTFKNRRAEVGRAAVENCAEEQLGYMTCTQINDTYDMVQVCHEQAQKFERCYKLQARFLTALGYADDYTRSASELEEIQMHGDTLYHRMLAQERAIADAKAANLPIPTFQPIIPARPKSTTTTSPTSTRILAATKRPPKPQTKDEQDLPPLTPELEALLKPETSLLFRKQFRDMGPAQREAEEKCVIADMEVLHETMGYIMELSGKGKKEERGKRKGWWGLW